MHVVFLVVLGVLFPSLPPGTPCANAIHQLRDELRIEVVAAQTVDHTLVYLLADKNRKLTAQLGCQED